MGSMLEHQRGKGFLNLLPSDLWFGYYPPPQLGGGWGLQFQESGSTNGFFRGNPSLHSMFKVGMFGLVAWRLGMLCHFSTKTSDAMPWILPSEDLHEALPGLSQA